MGVTQEHNFSLKNINLWSIDQKISLTFIIIFVLDTIITLIYPKASIFKYQWFTLHDFQHTAYNIWKYLTYGFLHADVIHLLLNILMMYWFSILFYTFFNTKQWLITFFGAMIFSGLFYESLASYFHWNSVVVGASGAITALLITVAVFRPKMLVRLPLLGHISIWIVALAFILIDLIQLPFGNRGGHITHLGGAFFGIIMGILFKNGFGINAKKKSIQKNNYNSFEKLSVSKQQTKMDDILDKIYKSGYDSLTQQEKDYLFRQKNS